MNLTQNPRALELTKEERDDKKNPMDKETIVRARKHFRLAKAIWNGPVGGSRANKLAKQLGVGFQYNGISGD